MRLVLFFATFTLLYGGLHLYVLWRARRAFPLGRFLKLASGLFLVIMLTAPLSVRYLERFGQEWAALKLAHVGFLWMGFLFLLVCASLFEDGYRLGLAATETVLKRNLSAWKFSRRRAFVATLLVAAGITLYGYFEALGIRTEHIRISTEKIPPRSSGLRIVQVSDVHLGLIVRESRLRRIVEAIRKAKPDILVSTGDLVDGQMDNLGMLSTMLREVPVKHGRFAVTGNHEFYAGIEKSLAFLERAGFTVLRGETRTLLPGLTVAGVDDPAGGTGGMRGTISEKELLDRIPEEHFRLLLKHRPFVRKEAEGRFDLQLSGHTHKGQIFPFTLIIKMMYPIEAGHLAFPHGSHLYVSRGTGTWGPPIRFLSAPEVTLIELIRPEGAG